MKKLLVIALMACAFVSACSSSDTDGAAKTRSSAVETLPAEDK